MDKFGSFAAWVGIVAFLLALPLSIVANLLTPRIQRWWANRTKEHAVIRLRYLSEGLSEINTMTSSDALSRCLLLIIRCILNAFISVLLFCFVIAINEQFIAQLNGMELDPPHFPLGVQRIGGIIAAGFSAYYAGRMIGSVTRARYWAKLVSEGGRLAQVDTYNMELEALKTKWSL